MLFFKVKSKHLLRAISVLLIHVLILSNAQQGYSLAPSTNFLIHSRIVNGYRSVISIPIYPAGLLADAEVRSIDIKRKAVFDQDWHKVLDIPPLLTMPGVPDSLDVNGNVIRIVLSEMIYNSFNAIVDTIKESSSREPNFIGKITLETFYNGAHLVFRIIDNGKTIEFDEHGKPKKRNRKGFAYFGGKGHGMGWIRDAERELGIKVQWHPLKQGTLTEIRVPRGIVPDGFSISEDASIVVDDKAGQIDWDKETIRSVHASQTFGKSFRNRTAFYYISQLIGRDLNNPPSAQLREPISPEIRAQALIDEIRKHVDPAELEVSKTSHDILLKDFELDELFYFEDDNGNGVYVLPISRPGTADFFYHFFINEHEHVPDFVIPLEEGKKVYVAINNPFGSEIVANTRKSAVSNINEPGLLIHGMELFSEKEEREDNRKRIVRALRDGLKPRTKGDKDLPPVRPRFMSQEFPSKVISLSMVSSDDGYNGTAASGYNMDGHAWGPITEARKKEFLKMYVNPEQYVCNIAFILDPFYVEKNPEKFNPIGAALTNPLLPSYIDPLTYALYNGLKWKYNVELNPPKTNLVCFDEVAAAYVPPSALVGVIVSNEYAKEVKDIISEEFPAKSIRIFNPEGELLFDINRHREEEQLHAINFVRQTKEEPKPSFIALGTSWIKGYEKDRYLQYDALNPLIASLRQFCDDPDHDIEFIDGDDEHIARRIGEIKLANPDAQGIVLAGQDMISGLGLQDDANVLLAGVNNKHLTIDSYIRLMEMLNVTLELFHMKIKGEDIDEQAIIDKHKSLGIRFHKGIITFEPDAEPMDYEILKEIYKLQRFA